MSEEQTINKKDQYNLNKLQKRLRRNVGEAIGSSGTVRAIGLAIKAGGHGSGEVNAEGLNWLKRKLFKLGEVDKIDFEGIKPDRRTIFPAGLAILEAIFDSLELQRMDHCDGALAMLSPCRPW